MIETKDKYLTGLLARNPAVVQRIYQDFKPRITKVVIANGGTKGDAADVFQDALIVIWRKAQADDFKLTSSFYSYLYGICYFVWQRKKKKKDNQLVTLDNVKGLTDVGDIEKDLEISDRNKLFLKHFKQLDNTCQQVLRLFFRGETMRDIAKGLGIESEHAARNRKYRCQKKLTKSILSDPFSAELIP